MIRDVSISNARIFLGPKTWSFPLSEITIFCGSNSAGKSTLLKTLLLLQQNFKWRTGTSRKPGVLQFSGKSVDLGDFQSFISQNDISKPLKISISIEDNFLPLNFSLLDKWLDSEILAKLKSDHGPQSKPKYLLKTDLIFVSSDFIYESVNEESQADLSPQIDPSEGVTGESVIRGVLSTASYEISIDDISILKWSIEVERKASSDIKKGKPGVDDQLRYFISLPANFFRALSHAHFIDTSNVPINSQGYMRIQVQLDGLFPVAIIGESIVSSKEGRAPVKKQKSISSFPLPPFINEALVDLAQALQSVIYIGPLRSPGRRYYVLNDDTSTDFDAAGEFLPYILRDQRNTSISFCRPTSFHTVAKQKLEDALNDWMQFLKTGKFDHQSSKKEFSPVFHKTYFGEIKVRGRDDNSHSLADTGFGYSQVLPILVRGLLARPGSLLIVEQPELHLHPALQIRLAQFFLAMSYSGKRVIIETHSEHIVNALRTLAAEFIDTDISGRLKIFFIDGETFPPILHDLSVLPNGTVPAWPKEFFGESISLSGRLLRAQRMRGPTK